MKKLILVTLFLAACSSEHDVVVSGTTTSEVTGGSTVTITLGIIDQLNKLCTDKLATTSYSTRALHDKAVADCVLEHLNTTIPSSVASTYADQYCGKNETKETKEVCKALGKGD